MDVMAAGLATGLKHDVGQCGWPLCRRMQRLKSPIRWWTFKHAVPLSLSLFIFFSILSLSDGDSTEDVLS
jgi:hypothetical protein